MTNIQPFNKILFLCVCICCLLAGVILAQESVTVSASNPVANTRSVYKINFTTTEALSPEASFEIVFPKDFSLSKEMIAGSRTMNGGLKVTVVGDTVLVKRSGLGSVIPTGTAINIMLSDIINPVKHDHNYQISLSVKSDRLSQTSERVRVPILFRER